jgi:transposase-like protein
MSNTPKTDAAIYEEDTGYNGMAQVVSPDFARELERENIMLREALEACSVFVTPLERLKNWNEYKAHAAELRRLALANVRNQPRDE